MKATERWFSERMQRPLAIARWGHFGTPVLLFPTAGGDAEEVERNQLVQACGDLLESGRIKLYSCDSVAGRVLAAGEGTPEYRMWLLNQFHQAVAHEVVPAIQADSGHRLVTVAGSSIGAFNAVALLTRFPHLFRLAIALSGTFDVERFVGGWTDDLYYSTPMRFLPGLDGPALELLQQRFVLLASGTGAWEDVDESWRMADVLGSRGIPNRVDNWGPDFEHEWPTWWAMLPQYLHELLRIG